MPSPRVVMTGIALGESPRWHDGRLWFSDWGAHEVIAVDAAGKHETVLSVPSFPMCIDFLPDGRLLVVSSEGPRLLRREADGSIVTHAELGPINEHPWNDIVVDGRGNVYVNNVNFDFPGGETKPGIVVVVTPNGSVREVADGLMFPNGMAITPDNQTLIVAESYAARLTAYDIEPDGGLSGRRTWAALDDAAPDGICIDTEGAVWYADVPHQRCVRVREGGQVLDTVELDRGAFACMLGGTDQPILYINANEWRGTDHMHDDTRTGQLIAVDAPAARAGWP